MQPFRVGDEALDRSVAVDGSRAGNTYVTVAVGATRAEEVAVLDSFYQYGAGVPFKPFYQDTTADLYRHHRRYFERLLRANADRMTAFVHEWGPRERRDSNAVEAVHSALLVHTLVSDPDATLVVVDGNEQQATPLVGALGALRDDPPRLTHCQQAEHYYPTALLADAASGYLARSLQAGRHDPAVARVRVSDPAGGHPAWGRAHAGRYDDAAYERAGVPAMRGRTVRERLTCWHRGAVAPDGDAPRPDGDAVAELASYADAAGYRDLAKVLSELPES